MEKRLHAVYKNGALFPIEPLILDEQQQVMVTVTDANTVGQDVSGYFTAEEWSKAEHDDITLDQVRQGLSTISGSLSDVIIALRQER